MISNKTTYAYDALKRLTNVTFDSPTPETPGAAGVKSRSITLDKLDNILKITDNESGMLTEIVGELEGKGKVLNQYSRFNGLPLEYDRNGNLSAKGSRLFTYDYKNRLIRSSRGDDAVTFTYDIFGRQTSRTDLSGTCHYFYSGDQKIEERNASGQVTKHYFWGNGIDELLRLDIYNGNVAKPYYVHSDAIGSTTTVTDENGNVVERVRYDAYGVPSFTDALGQSLKKSTIGNTTLFQGREYDYDLALYNYRARYFDPSQGRFLQTDPLGYQDSMNLYQGMGMNPVNFVDPWGERVIVSGTADERVELLWLLRFGVSEADWNFINLKKDGHQYIIDPDLIKNYKGQSENMLNFKALALSEKNTKVEFADEIITKEYGRISPSIDACPGYTHDKNGTPKDSGLYNHVVIGRNLPTGMKVDTLAHELLGHAYLEVAQKKYQHLLPHEQDSSNTVNKIINRIETNALDNFGKFCKKWEIGISVLEEYIQNQIDRYISEQRKQRKKPVWSEVIRQDYRNYYGEKINEFINISIAEWIKRWGSTIKTGGNQ